ncbi:chromosomal replication initiator protein DnaA [Edaphobacter dinghuensis]|uniref:Chromosomal replication initiator protein DnaA n=1 Tax=Edaphobacter dinghuensis TaxID=1560005 RepID=A0A917H3S4_9BACT|nr:chromosomal replication initiator protein DnaA [Edaphobacter dinghuensis]GGG66493.1 chromosomal replication initiator protein DnaA [Edaphobacter dinghuensis]
MSFVPTATAVLNHWVRILAALEKKINRQSYETWLKPTRFSHLEGKKLFVRIPSADFQHVGDRYADLIQEAIDNLGLDVESVTFTTPEHDPRAPKVREDGGFAPLPSHSPNAPSPNAKMGGAQTGARQAGPEQSRFDWNTASQLNPRYQFDAFVIGSGNQFAMAAAQAVAERPSKAYNPLFLYGGVGMGKTHLMHAIGHDVKRRQPHSSICYVSAEKFTNEMIDSVRYDKMTSFRDKFRSVDVLLIDDIQFLAGKERTQEQFFHTFNTLHESMKQIVIASDRPPKELSDFEDRLRSRFEWGLIADIQPPDLETKVAILQKKAESEQTALPTDVALFIASNVRTNVRELEGALVRLIAWCSMHGVEITLAVTQQCLKQFIDTQVRKITIEAIQRSVAEQFGMRVAELKQKNNSRQIVVPRQIAMYLAKQLTEASLPEIGRQFGGKHHTTVMHSIAKIDEQRRADKALNQTVNKLMETLS